MISKHSPAINRSHSELNFLLLFAVRWRAPHIQQIRTCFHVLLVLCQEIHARSIYSPAFYCLPILLPNDFFFWASGGFIVWQISFFLFMYDLVNIHPSSLIQELPLEESSTTPHCYHWNIVFLYLRLSFFSVSPGEAVGHLLCVLKQSSLRLSLQARAERIIQSLWAQPSVGGAQVVATVLSNPAHRVEWWVWFRLNGNLVFEKRFLHSHIIISADVICD